jgi:hypothetical protein
MLFQFPQAVPSVLHYREHIVSLVLGLDTLTAMFSQMILQIAKHTFHFS